MEMVIAAVIVVATFAAFGFADLAAFNKILSEKHGFEFLEWAKSREARVARRFGGAIYILLRRRLRSNT